MQNKIFMLAERFLRLLILSLVLLCCYFWEVDGREAVYWYIPRPFIIVVAKERIPSLQAFILLAMSVLVCNHYIATELKVGS